MGHFVIIIYEKQDSNFYCMLSCIDFSYSNALDIFQY
jgi:hypothetical protein